MKFKNKIRITLALTIITVVVIRAFLPTKKSNTEVKKDFWIRKTHLKSKENIVVGGNSRIYRGISIKAIKEVLSVNLDGVNLGYSASGFDDEYLTFLESRLDLESKYKILVLGLDPGPLSKIAAQNKSYHGYKNIAYSEIFKTLYINPYFNISTYRPLEILNLIKYGENSNGFIEDRKNYFANYGDDGWVASYKIPNNPKEALPIYKKFAEENKMSIDTTLVNNLFSRIEEFVRQGVTVIAFRPPSTNEMQDWENDRYNFDEAFFESTLEKLGGHWLNVNTDDYSSYDGAHLHYLSAKKLSATIGQKIEEVITKEQNHEQSLNPN